MFTEESKLLKQRKYKVFAKRCRMVPGNAFVTCGGDVVLTPGFIFSGRDGQD